MRLWNSPLFVTYVKRDYGARRSHAPFAPYRSTFLGIIACILLSPATLRSAHAQQANQPGFDPRLTEKYFDDRQSGADRPLRPPPRTPTLARPEITADTKPLFVLHAISVSGAFALPREALAAS